MGFGRDWWLRESLPAGGEAPGPYLLYCDYYDTDPGITKLTCGTQYFALSGAGSWCNLALYYGDAGSMCYSYHDLPATVTTNQPCLYGHFKRQQVNIRFKSGWFAYYAMAESNNSLTNSIGLEIKRYDTNNARIRARCNIKGVDYYTTMKSLNTSTECYVYIDDGVLTWQIGDNKTTTDTGTSFDSTTFSYITSCHYTSGTYPGFCWLYIYDYCVGYYV